MTVALLSISRNSSSMSGIVWECLTCHRSTEMALTAAQRRFERTTVHQPDRVADAFVCQCGGLLAPFLDQL